MVGLVLIHILRFDKVLEEYNPKNTLLAVL
jgi:hypothetical protein